MLLNSINDIACIIISYNPLDNLKGIIGRMLKQCDLIIIVDNNSINIAEIEKMHYLQSSKIILIKNSENQGIASALNTGVNNAIDLGYKWVVTFDQDSIVYNNATEILIKSYNSIAEKETYGALGLNYKNEFQNIDYRDESNRLIIRKVDYIITSGSLLNVENFKTIGGFNEKYFIDNVDIEYCLRIRKNNRKIYKTTAIGMVHGAGEPNRVRFLFMEFKFSNHSAIRRFYMARNHFYLLREYFFIFPYFSLKISYFFILSVLKIFLFETQKSQKIRQTIKGSISGLLNINI
jgi:rhamnosyltransferase